MKEVRVGRWGRSEGRKPPSKRCLRAVNPRAHIDMSSVMRMNIRDNQCRRHRHVSVPLITLTHIGGSFADVAVTTRQGVRTCR